MVSNVVYLILWRSVRIIGKQNKHISDSVSCITIKSDLGISDLVRHTPNCATKKMAKS